MIANTTSGVNCVAWLDVEQAVNISSHDPLWPDNFNWSQAGSYCRNPRGSKDAPWCYVSVDRREWGYCSVPICGEYTFVMVIIFDLKCNLQ